MSQGGASLVAHGLWIAGCLLGATGVAFGAFGAHGLRRIVADAGRIRSWETAANYQLLHAVPVLLSANHGTLQTGGTLLAAGSFMFAGSIYALVLKPTWRWLGPVTPAGGLLLIAGWASMLGAARGIASEIHSFY